MHIDKLLGRTFEPVADRQAAFTVVGYDPSRQVVRLRARLNRSSTAVPASMFFAAYYTGAIEEQGPPPVKLRRRK